MLLESLLKHYIGTINCYLCLAFLYFKLSSYEFKIGLNKKCNKIDYFIKLNFRSKITGVNIVAFDTDLGIHVQSWFLYFDKLYNKDNKNAKYKAFLNI